MPTKDRRSGVERRGTHRFQTQLDVEWETSKGKSPGLLSDVNLDGCFILSSGDVIDGEDVRVHMPADRMKLEFGGRVVNHVVEIGFAVKFDPLSPAQRGLLVEIVRKAEQT